MTAAPATPTLLGGYRALDLAGAQGLLCGKLLADMGADVIKIEPPGGDPARNIGPFYHDIPDPERSLSWFSTNLNKRGVTLDITTADGRDLLRRMAAAADLLIESYPPGYLDSLGLGYAALREVNPRLIVVSITPYGQTGPHAHYQASDLVLWARGGMMYLNGEQDRPPIQVSIPQAYFHAGAEAAAAAMTALYARGATGEGQHVDVSIQACVIWTMMDATGYWDLNRINRTRGGSSMITPNYTLTGLWQAKDGYVTFVALGGTASASANMKSLVAWMDEYGMANDYLRGKDFLEDYSAAALTQDEVDRVEAPIQAFFATRTKAELWEGALARRIILAPAADVSDVLESPQLHARGFLVSVEHEELNTRITYPGAFVKLSETPITRFHRAPLIGEHNLEVYAELGLSVEEQVLLKQAGVI